MKACPHCGEEIAQLAVWCPHCRSQVEAKEIAVEPSLPIPPSTPDYGGYILAGGSLTVMGVGVVVAAASSDADSGVVVGSIIAAIGGMALFVGLVGLGVYIGMRQFDLWQRNDGERSRD
jgi:hypothetical protein